MVEPGGSAPPFTAVDERGEPFALSDLAGSWVVLWWYPKASTSGCTREGQGFRDRAPDFARLGAEIVGISFDTPEDNRIFKEAHDFPYRLISDPDRAVGHLYGVEREPDERNAELPRRMTFIIDPAGNLAKVYVVTDSAGHPAEVLEDLRTMGVGDARR